MHMYITIFCIICTLFLIFYKWNIVNQFSNNLVESFTATETNIKIANLQTALENIESRIPYFSQGTIDQGNTSNMVLRGTELNNISLDFTVKPSHIGPRGETGPKGESGDIGQMGHIGKQGITGYWF